MLRHPPDCQAIKKLTLRLVWLVEWKHREQRTQLSSHTQSLDWIKVSVMVDRRWRDLLTDAGNNTLLS